MRPAAWCALAAAGALLAAAQLGGEAGAQETLSKLARSPGFLSCVTALEFGVRADAAEVYVPRAAAAARDEDAVEPQSESVYVPSVPENTAPVLSAPDKAATLTINNDTDYDVDVAACLASDTHIRAEGDGPQVLVFHTHASESYTPDAAFPYTPTETERTTDTRYNVVRVGDELCTALEKRGIETLHLRSLFDTPTYAGSYDRSLAAIEQALEENPSVKVVIDLHRDSAPRSASILESDGVTYAKMMFVVGMKSSNAAHVMEHSRQLTDKINQVMPGIMRSVFQRQSVYNQDMAKNMVLLELGTDQNSTEEVRNSLRILVEALTNGGIE